MSEQTEELGPCTWCGSTSYTAGRVASGERDYFDVCCDDCFMRGPECASIEDAVASWIRLSTMRHVLMACAEAEGRYNENCQLCVIDDVGAWGDAVALGRELREADDATA